MNITKPLTAIAVAMTLAGTHAGAFAQEAKSRAQVQAELADAVRTGDIVTGEFGFKRNEIWPANYPAQTEPAGKTREQVRAELDEAVRTGDVVTGDFGFKRNEIAPALYASNAQSPSVKAAPATDGGRSCKFDARTIAWGYPQGAFGC
jgi:hypothetical protein